MMGFKGFILRSPNTILFLFFHFNDYIFARHSQLDYSPGRTGQGRRGTKLGPSHLYSFGFKWHFFLDGSPTQREFKSTIVVWTLDYSSSFIGKYCLHHQVDVVCNARLTLPYMSTKLRVQGAISQKVVIFITAAVKTWNVVYFNRTPFRPTPREKLQSLKETFITILISDYVFQIEVRLQNMQSFVYICLFVCFFTSASSKIY
jgi:hypothetical protein